MSESPTIDFDSLFSETMTIDDILRSPPSTPSHYQNGYSPAPSGHLTSPAATSAHGTPTRASRSAAPSSILSSLNPEDGSPNMGQSRRLSHSDPPAESPSISSSAVGRGGVGKSGRIIDRVVGENERLKRDLTIATVKLEEELHRGESASMTLESLRATNQNLVAIHDTDKAALARRDRKLEELKADLAAEKSRREKAEADVKHVRHEHNEAIKFYKNEALEAQEQGGKAVVEHRILSQSWSGLEEGFKKQTEDLANTLTFLQEKREQDLKLIAERDLMIDQLQVMIDQLRKGLEKSQKANADMAKLFEDYKKMQDESLQEMKERAERKEVMYDKLASDMAKVVGEMKHVMNVKKNVKGIE